MKDRTDERAPAGRLARVGVVGLILGGGLWVWATGPGPPQPEPPWTPPGAPDAGPAGPVAGIHVAVQRRDCPDALRDVERLAARAREAKVPFRGILLPDGTGRSATAGALGLSFSLRPDEDHRWTRLLRALGFHRTPAVLLVDADGRLREAMPGAAARNLEEEVIDHARALSP